MGDTLQHRCFENPVARQATALPPPLNPDDLHAAMLRLRARVLQGPHYKSPSLYVGGAGVAYALLRTGGSSQEAAPFLADGVAWAAAAARRRPETASIFIDGPAGVLYVAVLWHMRACEEEPTAEGRAAVEAALSSFIKNTESHERLRDDEWLYGRAGYLLGVLALRAEVTVAPASVLAGAERWVAALDERAAAVFRDIVSRGRAYAKGGDGCGPPMMHAWHGKEYLGAAHGVCGIWYALLRCAPLLHGDCGGEVAAVRDDIRRGLEWLWDHARSADAGTFEGNYPSRIGARHAALVHFCHGAPGFVFLFLEAFNIFGDGRYLGEALRLGELVWRRGLLRKGPGVCHGMAGNAYALLAIHNALAAAGLDPAAAAAAEEWLRRAHYFAFFALGHEDECRAPDRPLSLFEGISGTMCLLRDLQVPQHAAFPLFEPKAALRHAAN